MTRTFASLAAATLLATPVVAGSSAEEAHSAYLAAINSNDLDTFLGTVTDDIVFIAPNAPVMEGKDQITPWVAGYFEAVDTQWEKTSVELLVADDWAYERYTYKVTDTPRGGGAAMTDTGSGVNIYKRGADGVWRVARDIWASDQPAASQ